MNVQGLLPYVFTSTSHLRIRLSLGLRFWLSYMIAGGLSLNSMFAHLVPLGCPVILIPFIVVIERIRLVIRPLTLSIRLTANMIAGHIIMALISMGSINRGTVLLSSIASEVLVTMLEIGVAVIQPYVFFILLSLYSQEVS